MTPIRREVGYVRDVKGTAIFSDCSRFRYVLTRSWNDEKPKLCFIGLNPSIATAEINDPTIRRCMGYAMDWGLGGILMLNLFAYRATDPADMFKARKRGVDITGGRRNYFEAMREYISEYQAALTIAAWGNHGGGRGREALREIPRIHYLRLNANRSPAHPLYLPSDLRPTLWT